jgi:uncharacterized protein YdbL (DUF1318 family)
MNDKPDLIRSIQRRAGITACLRVLVVAAMMMCGLTAGSSHALAQSLDAARSSGMVGEQSDGYAVARGSATPAVRKLVTRVNGQRRKIYAKRAREQNISVANVGRFYAAQIAAKAPKGTWIQSSSGAWKRK